MSSWTCVGQGSTKDLYFNADYPGHVFFEFSDRVSVFDYGALPDGIPSKGESLKRCTQAVFSWFQDAGLDTAYDPAVTAETNRCALRSARHPKFPALSPENADLKFIPLEVVFRWGVVPGSSLLKREKNLKPYDRFDRVRIEYFTKLEATDRLVSLGEAVQLAGSEEVFKALDAYAHRAAELLKKRLKGCGLDLWDGKIECAWDAHARSVVMVDGITPDELRCTLPGLEGVPLSKELLRQWIGGTNWAFDVLMAKKKHVDNWKMHVSPPPRLGEWRLDKLSGLYRSFAETLEKNSSAPLMTWVRSDSSRPKVFVSGNGGREDALRWRLIKEGCDIAAAPEEADCVWISPDGDLSAGMVNEWDGRGCWTFGPRRESARIESSKSFGKAIAEQGHVPLAKYSTDASSLRSFPDVPVVKFDGLAAGKGVVVADTWDEAEKALAYWSKKGPVVLEERLRGFEASAFFAVETGYNGVHVRFLGSAKDFKRRFPADEGPNTGGMGAHSPHPALNEQDIQEFRRWAEGTARALYEESLPYNGILYIGGLKDKTQGWKLLEYNARFGDPETEALVCTWGSAPVLRSLLKLDVKVDHRDIVQESHALCVALVRKEYPESAPHLNLPEWDFRENSNCTLFRNTSGSGRVAFIVGRGSDLLQAGDHAFGKLIDSPWKDHLDWRADLIP